MELTKAQKIIDLFNYDEDFHFWNINTKITTIIDNFYENFLQLKESERKNHISIIEEDGKYGIFVNLKPVTPSKDNQIFVSNSAKRQYLEILMAFNIIEKFEGLDSMYKITQERLLQGDHTLHSTSDDLDFISDLKTTKNAQAKKIKYGVIISYVLTFCSDFDSVKIKKRGNKEELINVKDLKKDCKDCGYNLYNSQVKKYGLNLDELYNNILNIITK